jgi:hypothetical protein
MATPTTSDFLVVPINGTDLIAFYRGSNISRPLYLSYSNFLAILTQAISGGTNILLQTNNVDNPAQNVLNLIEGTGIDIVATAGGVTISASGGSSFITSISDTTDILLDVTASDLSATLTATTVVANTYGTATQVPQITVDSKGRVTGVTNVSITAGTGSVINVATAGLISGGPITVSGTITTSMASGKLVGRYSSGAGIMQEITIGTGINLSALGVLTGTSGTPYTANNGLTESPANNFQLGGTLIQDTTINGSTFGVVISSAANVPREAFKVTNSGSGAGILGESTSSATGVGGVSASGIGVSGSTTSGSGVVAIMSGGTGVPLLSTASNATTNTILTVINLTRETTGTAGNNIGQQIVFNIETDANVWIANKIISKWTNAVEANRTSQIEITTVNNTIESTALTLKGTGQLQLNQYTGTTFDGTATKALGVDASGNVITFTGGGGSGTVTSVGLTMPSAFAVAGSPVTTSGTLAVTGAGTTSQYVRGDGSLATYNPGTGGGGASVSYYLNGSVNQTPAIGGLTYKQMSKTPVIGAGTDFTINADGYIQSFITDSGSPNQLLIPAGNWNFEMYFSASSNGGSPSFYVELYKWDGAALTLIASSSANPEYITNGTAIDLYVTALAVPQTTLAVTDRLAVRVYVIHSSKTIKLHTEDSHLCQVITTFSTGITALNGLTDQVQNFATPGTTGTTPNWSSVSPTHTLNIPLASTASVTAGLISKSEFDLFSVGSFGVTFDGGGALITSGKIAYVRVPYKGTITGWQLVADQLGSCSIAVKQGLFSPFPPTTTIITAALSGTQTAQAPSPLSLPVVAEDWFSFTITGTSAVQQVNLSISITKII